MKKTVIAVAALVVLVFGGALWKYPPVSSSDAAGWVQACGSIVAIGLAVWLQFEAATDRRKQAGKVARAFAGQLMLSMDALQLACRNQQWPPYSAARQILQDTLGMDVPIGELDADLIAMALTLRGIAFNALAQSEEHRASGNWQQYDTVFGNAGHDVRSAMARAGLRPAQKSFSP